MTAANRSPRTSGWLWVLLPVACHFGFSWIGFSPTDDGWLPAVTRRIADGEVPHRDFIFVRPALSALLQLPLIWWGGDYVVWLSRLWGWVMLGAVCWVWTRLLAETHATSTHRYMLYVVGLIFCAHTFPVMAWHTLDGLFFCTLAVALLRRRGTRTATRLAFLAVGTAGLCRQNFALFLPFLLLARGGNWRDWLAGAAWSAVPLFVYMLLLAPFGALTDFLFQLRASEQRSGSDAVFRFVFQPGFWLGSVVGVAITWLITRLRHPIGGEIAFGAAALTLAWTLYASPGNYGSRSFGLLGVAVGTALAGRKSSAPAASLLWLASGLAWTISISLGYPSPALAAGILVLACRSVWLSVRRESSEPAVPRLSVTAAVLLCAVIALHTARKASPYFDRSHDQLDHEVGDVVKGASLIRTNPVTYRACAELRILTDRFAAQGRKFAIFTDYSAFWIRSVQRNPLPCEWPQMIELARNSQLHARVLMTLPALPSGSRLIVQKHIGLRLHTDLASTADAPGFYSTHPWIEQHAIKLGETEFFTIYEPIKTL